MTLELRTLRAFVAVAEQLNFRRAAQHLNIAQPAVTRAVRQLEDAVGVSLLRRTTRRVELTEAGSAFVAEARLALAHAEQAMVFAQDAAHGKRGQLKVAYTHASISGPVPEIVTRYRNRYPSVRLTLQELWSDQQAVALENGDIDIGFGMPAAIRPSLDYLIINSEPFVAVLPHDHALAAKPVLSIAELRDQTFVMGNWDRWRHFREIINNMCLRHGGFLPNVVQEEAETHVILGLIAAHVGVTLYPECISNYHRWGVAIRPFAEEMPQCETVAVWPRESNSEQLRNFVAIIKRMTPSQTQRLG